MQTKTSDVRQIVWDLQPEVGVICFSLLGRFVLLWAQIGYFLADVATHRATGSYNRKGSLRRAPIDADFVVIILVSYPALLHVERDHYHDVI